MEAAENGDLDKVQQYFNLDPLVIECVDKDGYTPLHRACYGNHTHVVKVHLLKMTILFFIIQSQIVINLIIIIF